jgi:hypothetical protein
VARDAEAVATEVATAKEAAGDAEDEDPWELHDGLALAGVGFAGARKLDGEDGEEGLYYKTFTVLIPGIEGGVALPMRVGPQFRNVGMSLWPSAFALVNTLIDELLLPHASLMFDSDVEHPLRILELGSGVGFTGCVVDCLRHMRAQLPSGHAKRRLNRLESFVSTDYQEVVLENARRTQVRCHEACMARRANDAADDAEAKFTKIEILDWTEAETNRAWLQQEQFDVIVAADVTYDIEVNPDLARTIADALRTSRQPNTAKCILFATHRNADTFAVFREAVAKHGCLMSEDPVDVRGHAAYPEHVMQVITEATSKLQGMAATAVLNGLFWCEMPDLLRRHVITLGPDTPASA